MAAGETAGKVTIDHHSPVPKYSQLREILLDLVETELDEDQSIPAERELSARFGLSRMTVRQAVDHLVSEGRLYRVQGKGTFVARPKIEMPLRLASFTEDMRARGLEPGSRDLDQAVFLGEWLVRTETALDAVLEMRVPDEEIVRRLSGRRTCGECGQIWHVDITLTARHDTCDACGGALHQRDDDTETSIRRRLEIYHQQTAPLTAFFDDRGFLVSIDATGPVGAVTRRATTALAGR